MAKDSNAVLVVFVILVVLISAISTWRALKIQDENNSGSSDSQDSTGYAAKAFVTTGNFGLKIIPRTNDTKVGA